MSINIITQYHHTLKIIMFKPIVLTVRWLNRFIVSRFPLGGRMALLFFLQYTHACVKNAHFHDGDAKVHEAENTENYGVFGKRYGF